MKTYIQLSINERINLKGNMRHICPSGLRLRGYGWFMRNRNCVPLGVEDCNRLLA